MCPYLQDKKCLLERPKADMCLDCKMSKRDKVTGLGDLVALTINTTPARYLKWKTCNCTKRQDWLNRVWSFVPKPKKIKPMTLQKRTRCCKPINKELLQSESFKAKRCGCGKVKQNGNTDMDRRR
mgnify:CR=1 FL=1|jgi:hypothetical protein